MTGNPSLDKILLGLNAIVVTAAVGLVYYSHNILKKPGVNESDEFSNMVSSSVAELKKVPIIFDDIVVNLYSRETRLRFLSTQMNVDTFEEKDRQFVKDYKFFILDSLIDITGNMKPSELNSITGRILLEARIKSKFNKEFKKPIIKKIFFSKFIIQ